MGISRLLSGGTEVADILEVDKEVEDLLLDASATSSMDGLTRGVDGVDIGRSTPLYDPVTKLPAEPMEMVLEVDGEVFEDRGEEVVQVPEDGPRNESST